MGGAKKTKSILNNLYIIKLLFRISPFRVIFTIMNSLISTFTWAFFSIVFLRYIIDENQDFKAIITFIVTALLIFLLLNIFSSWYDHYYRPNSDQQIKYRLNIMVFNKSISSDIGCFENTEFYNKYTGAINEVNERSIAVLDNIAKIVSLLFSSVYVLATMIILSPISTLFVAIPVIGSLILGKKINDCRYENYMDDLNSERQKEYVNRTILLKNNAKEIRLTNIYNVLLNIYNRGFNSIISNIKNYEKRKLLYGFIRDFLCAPIAFESVWLYAAYQTIVKGSINMSGFIVLASAVVAATNMMLQLTGSINTASDNSLYIDNLKTFLEYKTKINELQDGLLPSNGQYTLEFRDVTFYYEGQDTPALEHISFKISSGEKIALVGQNGAGKTTLIKLILRLYDPTDGVILLNNVNIKEYNLHQYRNIFGTVLQDYQIFAISILENVIMNNVKDKQHELKGIMALKNSGLYEQINSYEKGINSILTKEFDEKGVELSGGERQKLAIARAFARNSDIIILDEPSSALDPIAEAEIFDILAKLYHNQQKIVITISHRLSFALSSDKVIYLEEGKIREYDSHVNLMKLKGKYYEMFQRQADNYL